MNKLKNFFTILAILSLLGVLSGPSLAVQQKTNTAKSTKININTAEVEQLVTLPKIGEKTAQRIVEFRKKNGKFKKIEDLMKVKGIGEKIFKGLEKRISI